MRPSVVLAVAQDGKFLLHIAVDEGQQRQGREQDVGDEGRHNGGEGGRDAARVSASNPERSDRKMGQKVTEKGLHQPDGDLEHVVGKGKAHEVVPNPPRPPFDVVANLQQLLGAFVESRHDLLRTISVIPAIFRCIFVYGKSRGGAYGPRSRDSTSNLSSARDNDTYFLKVSLYWMLTLVDTVAWNSALVL